ncbi:MAG: T9SS type A sorting domain-containing protein [Chlorobi bacterium]|nr:T9SS type A sorting domain-containing protein [Chlorobiota bacterium]
MKAYYQGADSVVIGLVLVNSGPAWQATAIMATVAYNPQEVTPWSGTLNQKPINNHYFAQFKWTSLSNPWTETNGVNPDLITYTEIAPTNKYYQIKQGETIELCRMVFHNTGNPNNQKTNFSYYGNITGSGVTGYKKKNDAQQYAFTSVKGLKDIWTPVELVSFQARVLPSGVRLSWETSFESKSLGFRLQRRSAERWDDITWIHSPSEDGSKTYVYDDVTVASGTWYQYRLVQVDIDGRTEIFEGPTVYYQSKAAELAASVYPNPVVNRGNLEISVPADGALAVTVYDQLGRMVQRFSDDHVSKGIKVYRLEKFRPGMYMVGITHKDGKARFMFVQQ